jgi:hypothetical protein
MHLLHKVKTSYIFINGGSIRMVNLELHWPLGDNELLPLIHITFHKYKYIYTYFSARYIYMGRRKY